MRVVHVDVNSPKAWAWRRQLADFLTIQACDLGRKVLLVKRSEVMVYLRRYGKSRTWNARTVDDLGFSMPLESAWVGDWWNGDGNRMISGSAAGPLGCGQDGEQVRNKSRTM